MRTIKVVTPEMALDRLERMCVKAEHCTWEMRSKMRQWRIDDSDAEKIIESLVGRRFVDDARFARSFVHDKFSFSGWGRRRILLELRQRRIPADAIAEAMECIDPADYEALALRQIRRKVATLPQPLDYDSRVKVFRFAVSRGFEPDLVSQLLSKLKAEE